MQNQTMLLSMPNSGSDWFASVILKTDSKIKYFREFFNPVANKKYFDCLSEGFGSELTSSYKKIACFSGEQLYEKIYAATWLKEQLNFTKENYSAFKIPFFIKKFNCIAFTRQITNSFPPVRDEVFDWYEAIYFSMVENIKTLPEETQELMKVSVKICNNRQQKILMCHYIYQKLFLKFCQEYKIPVIRWEFLMGDHKDIIEELKEITFLNKESLISNIIQSRKTNHKKFDSYNFNPKNYLVKI